MSVPYQCADGSQALGLCCQHLSHVSVIADAGQGKVPKPCIRHITRGAVENIPGHIEDPGMLGAMGIQQFS